MAGLGVLHGSLHVGRDRASESLGREGDGDRAEQAAPVDLQVLEDEVAEERDADVVLVEAMAVDSERAVVPVGSSTIAAAARSWDTEVWLVAGVGRRLLEDALACCRDRGVSRLRVVSDPHAAGFYRRHGALGIGEVASTPAPRRLPVLEFNLDDGANAPAE